MCAKFYPDRLRFGSTRAKNILFWSKNRTAKPMLGSGPKMHICGILRMLGFTQSCSVNSWPTVSRVSQLIGV